MTPQGSPCLAVDRSALGEVWEQGYLPALTAALGLTANEVTRLDVCGEPPGRLSPQDLDRVRDASFVLVDLSGSPLTAAVLGLAVAHHKPVIVLRPDQAGHDVEIAGAEPRVYHGPEDVRRYLTGVVAYYEGRRKLPTGAVPDFLQRCGFPLAVLEGDGRYEYGIDRSTGERSVFLAHSTAVHRFPDRWRTEFERVLARQIEYAEDAGSVFFNGDLVRVCDYTPLRDERAGTRGLRISTQLTDYYSFTSSNHAWDFIPTAVAGRLERQETPLLRILRESVLANPLTVAVSLVVAFEGREWLTLQRRDQSKNFHGKQDFVCGATGMVSATRDLRSGEIDVYATAVNELREETGLRVAETDVAFLALVRETRLREIGLLAEVVVERDPTTISAPRADSFENEGFVMVPATPEALAAFVAENGPRDRFSPLSVGALLLSLLRRFSADRVEAAFADGR